MKRQKPISRPWTSAEAQLLRIIVFEVTAIVALLALMVN